MGNIKITKFMPYTLCIDIGATKIYTGLIKNNRVVKCHTIKTEKNKGLKYLLESVRKSIEMYRPERARAIGVSFAGPIDKDGKILHATNFPPSLTNYNLKKAIKGWFRKPVFVEHDGPCFALAESVLGAGKKYRHVIGLTIGTGIGGGFTVNKKIYMGDQGLMEIGHFKITEKGYRCSCGKYGHFESQVSGPALSKYYKKITGKNKKGEEIHKLALKKDRSALRAAKEMSYYLGIGLASLANVLSPQIIVIGGGVSRFNKIIDLSKKTLSDEVVDSRHKSLKIVKSKLEHDALLLGAYLITKGEYRIK